MKYMELIAPCHFGMEAVLKREILDLGYEISKVEDGKVTFLADAEGIAQANMFLRTTERILLKTGEFKAVTFDELFEKTKAIPWEEYIPKDGKFWVAKANSVKSALFSPSDIQSIMKKAIVERLKSVYGISWFQEDGASFPIEAAMIAADMAPGMNRSFLAEDWKHLVPRKYWYDALEEAQDRVNLDIDTDIQGYDIDPEALKSARANAKMAGVDKLIHFQQRAVKDLSHPKPYGFIITNPPYGERLEEKEALPQLYREIGESYNRLDKWSMYLITSYDRAENDIGRKADKNRKIYNGMLKTYYYQFLGPKPPRRKKD